MAKKTFEHTSKVTISSTDLQQAFDNNTSWEETDVVLMPKFIKSFDWDSILNSTKFNKHVKSAMNSGYYDIISLCE